MSTDWHTGLPNAVGIKHVAEPVCVCVCQIGACEHMLVYMCGKSQVTPSSFHHLL